MQKEFIPYEQALELKELGFDEPCFARYDPLKVLVTISRPQNNSYYKGSVPSFLAAPIFSQAFRWFREKHQLHSTITSISQESWQWHITKPGESLGKLYDEDFYTYEEAELACLKKLIEIVKKKSFA